jgi:hypothetical protein
VAIFTDNVSIAHGKNQVFGTQADLVNGEVVFAPIEDENSVDQLRDKMGMLFLESIKKL